MDAQRRQPPEISCTGLPLLDGECRTILEQAGQLGQLAEVGTGVATPLLLALTSLVERHTGHVECLLRDSDCLSPARDRHEALLAHMRQLQDVTDQPRDFAQDFLGVYGAMTAVLNQDAADLRRKR